MLVQAHAGGLGCGAKPERELERVEVAGSAVVQARAIALRSRSSDSDFGAFQHPRGPVAVVVLEFAPPGRQFLALAGLHGGVQVAPGEVAIDGVTAHAFPHELNAFDREIPQPARIVATELRGQCLLSAGVARESAVRLNAPRRRIQPFGLEQHDLDSRARRGAAPSSSLQCRRRRRRHPPRRSLPAQARAMGAGPTPRTSLAG